MDKLILWYGEKYDLGLWHSESATWENHRITLSLSLLNCSLKLMGGLSKVRNVKEIGMYNRHLTGIIDTSTKCTFYFLPINNLLQISCHKLILVLAFLMARVRVSKQSLIFYFFIHGST